MYNVSTGSVLRNRRTFLDESGIQHCTRVASGSSAGGSGGSSGTTIGSLMDFATTCGSGDAVGGSVAVAMVSGLGVGFSLAGVGNVGGGRAGLPVFDVGVGGSSNE